MRSRAGAMALVARGFNCFWIDKINASALQYGTRRPLPLLRTRLSDGVRAAGASNERHATPKAIRPGMILRPPARPWRLRKAKPAGW
jgi:hypothetical protein